MTDAWCYRCGDDHPPPRGKNCKKEVKEGYKGMSTRRTKLIDAEKMTPDEAAAAAQEEVNSSMAEVHGEDKFLSRAEYLEYLQALDEEQEELDRVETLERKIRDRITARVKVRGKQGTPPETKTPPGSRGSSPARVPRTSTPLFHVPHEGRDSSADRLTKVRKKFDLKRYTRGKEPRSLSYSQLMYISLNWACVGMDEGTFNDLGDIRKFLRHLGFLSFKASSDFFEDW